jgi:hypothetical protein
MLYRRAQSEDYVNIVALQNQNLITVINDAEKSNGFLATAFSVAHFEKMNRDLCVVVCYDNDYLCGYLGSSTLEFNAFFPIPAAMINRFAISQYKGKFITEYLIYLATPVCIDHKYRSQGVYLGLCKELEKYIPKQYELAVTFIADENKRSLKATQQLGFQIVDQFTENHRIFHTLVCPMTDFRQSFCEAP